MNRIIRWNPTREMNTLWNSMDRMLSDNYPMVREHTRSWGLALDVAENEDNFVVKASIPGISPDDINVTFEDETLTISGETHADESINGEEYRLRERRFGTFSRSIRFPVLVNSEAVEAEYAHGVLTLTVPKAEEVKPKRIAVKVNGN